MQAHSIVLRILTICALLVISTGIDATAIAPPEIVASDIVDGIFPMLTIWNVEPGIVYSQVWRKTDKSAWIAIDTIDRDQGIYYDSSCMPLTCYSYACVGLRGPWPEDRTEMSESVRVCTNYYDTVLVRPRLSVIWYEGAQVCSLTIVDSAAGETGHYIQRKTPLNDWELLADIRSDDPDARDTIRYVDFEPPKNTLLYYRAIAYRDTHVIASFEQTAFTCHTPPSEASYTFTPVYAFTAQKPVWIEQVGDSLYYPEIDGDSVKIHIVNIVDFAAPRQEEPVSPLELEQTTPSMRLRLRCRYHTSVLNVKKGIVRELISRDDGYTLIAGNNVIYCHDSRTSELVDSIKTSGGDLDSIKLAFFLTPSMALVALGGWLEILTITPDSVHSYPSTWLFIETYSAIADRLGGERKPSSRVGMWGHSGDTVIATYTTVDKEFNYHRFLVDTVEKTIIPMMRLGPSGPGATHNQIPFEAPYSLPVNEHFLFGCRLHPDNTTLKLYAIDARNRHSNPVDTYISTFTDMDYHGGAVRIMELDTIRHLLFVAGEYGVYIYRYQRDGDLPVAVNIVPPAIRGNELRLQPVAGGITVSGMRGPADRINIFDLRGRLISSLHPDCSGVVHWNGTAAGGNRAGNGRYLLMHSSGGRRETRSFTITR